jgi:hypothetical protein
MNWSAYVNEITPFVVKIRTQFSYGTGYIFWQNKDLCCIATANHVIEPATVDKWEQAIHITQPNGASVRYYPQHRNILQNLEGGDSAAILVNKAGLSLPSDCLPIWNFSGEIPIGTNVGWLGFPQVVDQGVLNPSFFSGNISNVFQHLKQYAIDGVAINGVSGGPLFCQSEADTPLVIGTISSYVPNTLATGGVEKSLPGISVAHSFSSFKDVVVELKDMETVEETIEETKSIS